MKSVFITGGGRGIGLATSKHFLDHGWRVGIIELDEQALKESLTACNHQIHGYKGDITIYDHVQKAIHSFAEGNEGVIDVLINNAGMVEVGEFEEMEIERHAKIIDVNLKGTINTTMVALPFLKQSENGTIISLSSASAMYGHPELTTYAATKSAIMSLTESWNLAFKKYGIRAADVLPIFVKTRMVFDYYQDYQNLQLKDVKLTPEDVARTIWKAVHGKGIHYYVGLDTKIYAQLIKWMPERWIPSIFRKVIGYR
jgi:short-subunit dehydrogenase